MESRPLGAVVLAAGLGTRMRSRRAKVLHELGGRPMLTYPLAAVAGLGPERVAVVVGHQADGVRRVAEGVPGLGNLRTVLQAEQRGTGHAVACATDAFAGFAGDVLIVYGDVPRIRTATLRRLVEAHREAGAALSLLTVCFADPTGYGRIVRASDGGIGGIVEEKDATPAERAITEINPGFYCVDAAILFRLLGRLEPKNAQGELYLTDLVHLARGEGRRVLAVRVDDRSDFAGVNTRAELAEMEAALTRQRVEHWMAQGVTFEDPASAWIGPDVTIGADTVVGPNVILRGATRIGEGCRLEGTDNLVDTVVGNRVRIRFACDAEGARIGDDAIVGPFARLRPGTVLAERVHIGNFVETKKAVVGAGTKANHLTYLGDCEIGPETNVGAGTITCNYDGSTGRKSKTTIGARVQIGSDTQLVAPVTVGDDAYVGAGTTVTGNVPEGALVVSRAPMRFIPGWTARRRARAAAAKSSNGATAPRPAKKAAKKPKPRAKASRPQTVGAGGPRAKRGVRR
jgi:bifunctional UDP-N-acetylglucosamine pyrophosphorylase/glucosamine-1-phosphate N-acetyltransferase